MFLNSQGRIISSIGATIQTCQEFVAFTSDRHDKWKQIPHQTPQSIVRSLISLCTSLAHRPEECHGVKSAARWKLRHYFATYFMVDLLYTAN
jgi:hypothetical protein